MTHICIDDVPDWSGQERLAACLQLMGAVLHWLITQPSRLWPDLLASVAAGDCRAVVEIFEDEDGPGYRACASNPDRRRLDPARAVPQSGRPAAPGQRQRLPAEPARPAGARRRERAAPRMTRIMAQGIPADRGREDAMDRWLCTACDQVKPWSDFVTDRLKPHGVGARCKEGDNARSRAYYARASVRKRARRKTLRAAAVAAYGGKCVDCGGTERLQFDHPNRDGAEHRALENHHSMIRRIAETGVLPDWDLELRCTHCHRKADAKRRIKAIRPKSPTIPTVKRCPLYRVDKPASAFYADKRRASGL
jgi:hypothetical protein